MIVMHKSGMGYYHPLPILVVIIILFSLGFTGIFTTAIAPDNVQLNMDNSDSSSLVYSRADPDSIAAYRFKDTTGDVALTDHRVEKYLENNWFDIGSITSQENGDRLWVNMTMYDKIQDDEEIYYKLKIADAEVLLFQGLGEIIYDDDFDDQVYYSGNTVSVNIDLQKLSYETFRISGNVYQEGTNSSFGDYIIQDEVGVGESNQNNSLVLSYSDPKDDTTVSYTYSSEVKDKPELDIIDIELIDQEDELLLSTTFGAYIGSSNGYTYIVELGNAEFIYNSGIGSIKYSKTQLPNAEYSIEGEDAKTLMVHFEKRVLELSSGRFEVTSRYSPKKQTLYHDHRVDNLPKYLWVIGEMLDLDITMFDNNNLVMRLSGTLNSIHSLDIRTQIDSMGNDDDIVDQSELDIFIIDIKNDFKTRDFLEFYPTLDQSSSHGVSSIHFENALGDVNNDSFINFEMMTEYRFSTISENLHNITFHLLDRDQLGFVGRNFIFNFLYDKISFNFNEQYKYWEFKPGSAFPILLTDELDIQKNKLTIHLVDYEILKNRVGEEGRFGFHIDYNETAAELDKKSKDNGKDDSSGFLPSFELFYLILILVFVGIVRKIRRANKIL
jgi:hypothetical protein